MAVARVNVTHGTGTGSTFATVTKPASTVDGNLVLVFFAMDGTATGNTVTPPDGTWTSLGTAPHPTGDGQYLHGFWKTSASDGTSWAFTSNLSSGNDFAYSCLSYSGQATGGSNWIDATAVSTTNSTGNTSIVSVSLTGITTVTDGCMLVWAGAGDPNSANTGTFGIPGGFTAGTNDYSNFAPLAVCDEIQGTHGATGALAGSLTFTGGTAGFAGWVVAIKPAAGSDVSVALTGTAITVSSGTLAPANSVALTGSTEAWSTGTLGTDHQQALTGASRINYSQGTLTATAGGDVAVALTGTSFAFSMGAITALGGNVASASSGGYAFFNDYTSERNRRQKTKQKQEQLEEDIQALQDKVDAEIALLLHQQDVEDERHAELTRLQALVRSHSREQLQLSERAKVAYVRALGQANFSALEALDRELQRQLDEEETTALMILLNED